MSERSSDGSGNEVTVERDGGLLTLTLNRPSRANALNPAAVGQLQSAMDDACAGSDIRAAVIRGNGKHFCAGFDLSDLDALSDGDLLLRFVRIEALLQAVRHAPFPVLVLAHGNVMGAGADLFAACWERVAAPGSRFGMPGWNFGLALGTRRLAELVGTDASRDMLIDSRRVEADEALMSGLATNVLDADQWPDAIGHFHARAQALPVASVRRLSALTVHDSRDADMAALVASAAAPGLKARVADYVAHVTEMRAARRAS